MPSDDELIGRAIGAWVKYVRAAGDPPPSWHSSTVEIYGGLQYVFLRDSDGRIAAVYRYKERDDTLLRMLRYWPGPYGRQRVLTYA